ncbi:MAG: 1-acyl-sn-glycerol-3-phosphate acyltransferase [Myxococcota bacterium]|nr:1-acyl-sn-glycerol-3-phosphate acyltransferase [Myxococcota bacterium]
MKDRRDATKSYRLARTFVQRLASGFFRQIDVTGLENIPENRGGLLISWHPNGLIDPGLILAQLPRPVVFGARHGLFRWPILGFVMRRLGTVPIFRASDNKNVSPEERRKANQDSLKVLAHKIASGSYSALFPEGVSHDAPHLQELKKGGARLFYQACRESSDADKPPVIIPVGLHYDRKRAFRSRALVWFHPPVELDGALEPSSEIKDHDEAELQVAQLTDKFEAVLDEVVHATDDWETHFLMHRLRKLVRSQRAKLAGATSKRPGITEKTLGFARIRQGYYQLLAEKPGEVMALRKRVENYDADLRELKLDDHHLDQDPRLVSPWLAALLVLQAVFVFLLLPPVLIFGYLANGPTALALWGLARVSAKQKKDEATIKILAGAIAFPMTWMLAAFLGSLGHQYVHSYFPGIPNSPLIGGTLVAILAAIGGMAALRYLHLSRQTIRALKIRLTRRRRRAAIAHLKVERQEIFDAVISLSSRLDLPGQVQEDGSIEL